MISSLPERFADCRDKSHKCPMRIGKFVQMTTDARIVSGKFQSRRIVFAFVTSVATDLFVFGNAVRKLAVIPVGNFLHNRCIRVFCRDRYVCFLLFKTTRGKDRKSRKNKNGFDRIFRFQFKITQLFCLFLMTRRNFKTADFGSMTVIALKNRLFISDAFFAFADFLDDLRAVTRTRTARQKRYVSTGQHSQIRRLRDADMANRAIFVRVICARVIEFQRKSLNDARFEIRRSQTMTTRAIGARRLLPLIMTVKTRSVIVRHIFEKLRRRRKIFRRRIC